MKKSYRKIIDKQKKRFYKKLLTFYKKWLKLQKTIATLRQNTNWRRFYFFGLIVFIFISFFWFWHYSLISAKGFIKIFPKTAEGSFQNLHEILTLENTESSGISGFNKNNSTFPALFMQENIYSFEVNLRMEDQTIILPSENIAMEPAPTTTTILGSTEITTTTKENIQDSTSNVQEEESITTTTTTVVNVQDPTLNVQEEESITTTTTTVVNVQDPTSNIQEEETTTTTTTTAVNVQDPTSNIQEEETTTTTTTTIGEAPLSKIQTVEPLLSALNNNLKGIGVFSFLADVAGSVVNNIETITASSVPINGDIILSGFVLPELLEDEVLTQFSDKKENEDILNVKLGMSLASKHTDINTDASLTIETFQKDHWEQVGKINLNKDIDNNKIGSYYYVNLDAIHSVEDIETLQVRIFYSTNNSNSSDRLYIDSVWMEIAINSELEAIINDNVSEVENKLFTQFDEFYNFDQDIIITIPKDQTKTKKIYKTKLEVAENIVEVNYNQTVVLDTTTTTTTVVNVQDSISNIQEENTTTTMAVVNGQDPTINVQEEESTNISGDGLTADEQPEIDADGGESTSEGASSDTPSDVPRDGGDDSSSETSGDSDNSSAPSDAPASSDVSSSDSSEVSSDNSSSSDSPSSSSDSGSEPSTSSEGTSTWLRKNFAFWLNLPKLLLASLTDLVTEEATTTTTTVANDQDSTTNVQEETTTTVPDETTTPNDQPEVGVGLPADGHGAGNDQEENTTTTANNIQTFTSPTTQYQPSADNSLVIGEELVAMDNFKLRSAILLTPDRKSYRNNISIDENEKEYIITIHHGPKLIPGKYQLMIKYRDNQELYKHVIDFIWGGEIIKEIPVQENIWCYFVQDNNQKQQMYIQIESSEKSYYALKINDLFVDINTSLGFIENRFFFIDQQGNLQGFDIINNSYFSQALEFHRSNTITINNQKYLINITNGIIAFTKQTD